MLWRRKPQPEVLEPKYIMIKLAMGQRLLFEVCTFLSDYDRHGSVREIPVGHYLYGLDDSLVWRIDACKLFPEYKLARVEYGEYSWRTSYNSDWSIECAFICPYTDAPQDLIDEYNNWLRVQNERREADAKLSKSLSKLEDAMGLDFANYMRGEYAQKIAESLKKDSKTRP